jgi:hypothetical protein
VGSHHYPSTGNYLDTLTGSTGCDSIVATFLTIRPLDTTSHVIYVCGADNSTSTDTLTSATGCDSIVTIHVTGKPLETTNQTIKWCPGDTIKVGLHEYHAQGIYHDTLVAANGCDSIITTDLSSDSCALGIPNISAYQFTIYPNPASNTLTITHNYNGVVRLEITTLLGERVKELYLSDARSTVDISEVAAGVYIVHITDGITQIPVMKLIKQ